MTPPQLNARPRKQEGKLAPLSYAAANPQQPHDNKKLKSRITLSN